ncbi:hypothetical protein WMF11_34995 [Sorangium sp. So ce295]|uniref:hypothetical protein n=1 Tax=Sorangium sp. So ce295 TaxID=3133295 RepID=UPI003F647353
MARKDFRERSFESHVALLAEIYGQLARRPALLLPDVRLAALDDLGAGARSRVLRRLVAIARDLVEEFLAPLRSPEVRALPGRRALCGGLSAGCGELSYG